MVLFKFTKANIAALDKGAGQDSPNVLLPTQGGDVPYTYTDFTDLFEQFHYKPATTVNQGLANFVAWYQNYFNL